MNKDCFYANNISPGLWILMWIDIITCFSSLLICSLIRDLFSNQLNWELHLQCSVFLFLMPTVGFFLGIYGLIKQPPQLELKNIAISISVAYISIAIFLLLSSEYGISRLVFVCSWLISLFLVPVMRIFVRNCFSKCSWWVTPVVLFGNKDDIHRQILICKNSSDDLLPVAWARLANDGSGTDIKDDDSPVPIFDSIDELSGFIRTQRNCCALFSFSDGSRQPAWEMKQVRYIYRLFSCFIFLPQIPLPELMGFQPVEISRTFGLLASQKLLDPFRGILKRCMELFLCFIFFPVWGAVLLAVALLIKLDSPGPLLFRQKRIGMWGEYFTCYKFRTMVENADKKLEKFLADHPQQAEEFHTYYKLRDDPRVTRVGKVLRRLSLDEIPQILNVIRGDMSLVGPRPIQKDEIKYYGSNFENYCRVRPGITGLWQVSGRNDIDYDTRVKLDQYYVSNWSLWMDLYILAKTIPVVFESKGAY